MLAKVQIYLQAFQHMACLLLGFVGSHSYATTDSGEFNVFQIYAGIIFHSFGKMFQGVIVWVGIRVTLILNASPGKMLKGTHLV